MNHIQLRRVALSLASLSFGVLMVVCLVCSSALPIGADGGEPGDISRKKIMAEQDSDVSLPYHISCTPLQVIRLVKYDGSFMEDGTGREVMDIAAVLLYNNSESIVPYACVTVYTSDSQYSFDAFMIPAKSSVLVPDSVGKRLSSTQIKRIFGWVTVKPNNEVPQILVMEKGQTALCIQNLSGNRVQDLLMYHRTYIYDGDFYLGGKAFVTSVDEIQPGGSVTIYPENYAKGYSRVVALEVR